MTIYLLEIFLSSLYLYIIIVHYFIWERIKNHNLEEIDFVKSLLEVLKSFYKANLDINKSLCL